MRKFTTHFPRAALTCQGPFIGKRTEPQYQEDIVRMTTFNIEFDAEVAKPGRAE